MAEHALTEDLKRLLAAVEAMPDERTPAEISKDETRKQLNRIRNTGTGRPGARSLRARRPLPGLTL